MMKKKLRKILRNTSFLLFACLLVAEMQAQSTFEAVQSIFEAKCMSCHEGDYAGGLNMSGTSDDMYNAIFGVTPTNPNAAQRGDELVKAGRPYKSFLLRKINNGLIDAHDAPLNANEGTIMPPPDSGIEPLTNVELETIRQWIYAGAPQTGNVVNLNTIETYYTNGGYEPLTRPEAPAEDEGFQIHFGPIFLTTSVEKEFLLKYDLELEEDIEVDRLDLKMNDQSHHFILYKFNGNAANTIDDGVREVSLFGENPFLVNSSLISTWQNDDDLRLPAGTAFYWDTNTVLDLNYHIPNYSSELILPADIYLNIYTQPSGTAIKRMKSDLLLYSDLFWSIPTGESILSEPVINNQDWNIWSITAHTHKLGTDFDVFLRDENGEKGEQIYEGFMDYNNCNCNIGYFEWGEPSIRYFEPYLDLPAGAGLIHEAKYNNTTNGTVSFGLTTNNEMMITPIQYYTGDPIPFVGVPNIKSVYCSQDEALDFVPAGGTLSGTGTVGTQFMPQLAGIGTHEVNYTYDGITATYDITVVPPPAPIISQNNDLLVAETGYTSYQWYKDGEPIEFATGISYIPTQSGEYYVEVGQYACTGFSNVLSVLVSGLDEEMANYNLNIFPNPYQEQSFITYNLPAAADVQIDIFNVVGQLVKPLASERQMNGEYNYTFSATRNNLPKGVYFVRVSIDGHSFSQKIIEQ